MYYQIWNFFLKEEKYIFWKKEINLYNIPNKLTWQKVIDFFAFVEQNFFLKSQLGEVETLEGFINLVVDNGYYLRAEEIAWFLVTRKQIWNLFDLAQKTPSLKEIC